MWKRIWQSPGQESLIFKGETLQYDISNTTSIDHVESLKPISFESVSLGGILAKLGCCSFKRRKGNWSNTAGVFVERMMMIMMYDAELLKRKAKKKGKGGRRLVLWFGEMKESGTGKSGL